MTGGAQRESEEIGAAIATTAATVDAPDALRARIAATGPPPRRPRRALATATVCLGIVFGIAVGLLAISDESGQPTVAAAARAALRPPSSPAPGVSPGDERFIQARVGAVRFPNYGYAAGWTVAGTRHDELSGRRALTVVYSRRGDRIGYAVVEGTPLAHPSGARWVTHAGRRFAVLHRDGARVVAWREHGHTCVLASRSAPLSALLDLATWS